jgi:hypothetical protein
VTVSRNIAGDEETLPPTLEVMNLLLPRYKTKGSDGEIWVNIKTRLRVLHTFMDHSSGIWSVKVKVNIPTINDAVRVRIVNNEVLWVNTETEVAGRGQEGKGTFFPRICRLLH